MNETEPLNRREARNGFTGKTLTNSQFDEAWANSEVIKRAIDKTGSFIEKLTDYSHAFSRTERFDQLRGESIIRDVFRDRYGQSMKQMRESLLEREATLPENARAKALQQARQIQPLIRDGDTMPFYRAYDVTSDALAGHLQITARGAKELMKSIYKETEGRELYDAGKTWEKTYHEPVKEAARQERAANRNQAKVQNKTKSRTQARA